MLLLVAKIIVPIAVVVAAAWGFMASSRGGAPWGGGSQATVQEQNSTGASSQISARGSSDASLDADMKDIDTQLQITAQNSASVDQGMQDQAVAQDY